MLLAKTSSNPSSRAVRPGLIGWGVPASAATVRGDRPEVRQKVVGEAHGLPALEVRVSGHPGLPVRASRSQPGLLERQQCFDDLLDRLAGEEAQRGRGLVIAAARGVQATRGFADAAEELSFDPGVDVLVFAFDREPSFLEIGQEGREPRKDRGAVVGREDAGLPKHPRMSETSNEVVSDEPAIERQRRREAVDVGIELALEPPAPELPRARRSRRGSLVVHSLVTGAGSGAAEAVSRRTAATTRVGRAHRLLKPPASFWS